jgi:hypothetical protein
MLGWVPISCLVILASDSCESIRAVFVSVKVAAKRIAENRSGGMYLDCLVRLLKVVIAED